jgi:anti-anti-sigma factor
MRASFEVRREGKVLILGIGGRLTLGGPVDRFREIVAGNRNIVVSFRELEYLDSAGLGELIGLSRQASVRLVDVPKRVRDLLRLTGSEALFNIQPDEPAAITSLL